jgi:hypothetical protein
LGREERSGEVFERPTINVPRSMSVPNTIWRNCPQELPTISCRGTRARNDQDSRLARQRVALCARAEEAGDLVDQRGYIITEKTSSTAGAFGQVEDLQNKHLVGQVVDWRRYIVTEEAQTRCNMGCGRTSRKWCERGGRCGGHEQNRESSGSEYIDESLYSKAIVAQH